MHKDHEEAKKRFGKDAAEWLKRWDDGETVWSVEMGGLGEGYERAIQTTTAEFLRFMIAENFDHQTWADKDVWAADRDRINAMGHKNEVILELGLSGAQAGAAMSLATQIYMRDPWVCFMDSKISDRLIQTEREMPRA